MGYKTKINEGGMGTGWGGGGHRLVWLRDRKLSIKVIMNWHVTPHHSKTNSSSLMAFLWEKKGMNQAWSHLILSGGRVRCVMYVFIVCVYVYQRPTLGTVPLSALFLRQALSLLPRID